MNERMTNGIITVAFGQLYDRMAAHCFAFSRRYTDLPIVVLSNLENPDPKWDEVSGVTFKYLPWQQDMNRQAKTTMVDYSPFDRTLFIDCDAIVQRPGIERFFDLIPDDGLLLNIYSRWTEDRQAPSLYRRAMQAAELSFPISIYYGACMGFKKSPAVDRFFMRWNEFWRRNGSGREMPALACAVKNTGIVKRELSRKDGLFSWPICGSTAIQHEYQGHLRKRVGCPEFRPHKPFDRRGWNVGE